MLKFKLFNKYELIYLTFAFDSLLKIPIGSFKLHIGVLLILLLLTISLISSLKIIEMKNFIFKNWTIFLFMGYLFINIILNHSYPGIAITLAYYFLALSVFYFVFIKEKFISCDAIVVFQWILIFTGLFQYALFKFFGIQLSFIGSEHYDVIATYVTRLRGFFVEPNWQSIIFAFNTLLLVMILRQNIFRYKFLITLTILVFFLNASYTFFGIIIIGIFFRFFIDLPKVSIRRFFILFFILFVFGVTLIIRSHNSFMENKGNVKSSTLINYGSRFYPALNTTLFMSKQTVYTQLFGYGVGSWPYVGLEQNNLGYIGMSGEYTIKPAQRDSAEYQVFLLELGYVGLILFLLDFFYNSWKYRRLNFVYSLATAFLLASFFVYPIFKFSMYLIPYYIIRAKSLKES